ncbi:MULTISPECIES: hypothetical protein [unclassified Pseudomonas]|uniref:hypothetical protein n=1 Tax=unclassified Pseudomonas TaxID=196821 RepID=UPI00131D800A|nr:MULTISPECIES: hypothetical protein [unclassified Pseudomonas]
MARQSTATHPDFPFIKIRRLSEEQGGRYTFLIEDYEHTEFYETKEEAIAKSERVLFSKFQDLTVAKGLQAFKENDMHMAVKLAERWGYFRGRRDERESQMENIRIAANALRAMM